MAFSNIESSNPTADSTVGGAFTTGSTAATSHNLVLPATITAGSLLFACGRVAVAGAVAFPAGWTVVQDSSDGSDDVTFWAYRDTLADGTEDGANVNVTHGNGKIAGYALSITGAEDPATQPPEASTVAVGTTTTPDPTTCTPTGGAKDYLWLWFGGWDGEQTLNKTAATSYTDVGDTPDGDVSTGTASTVNCQMKLSERDLNAASENPGAVTISAAPLGWTAWTIAIHPGAGGITNNETGSLTAGAVVAGADVHENVEAGSLTPDTTLVGGDVHENVEAGTLMVAVLLAGADVHENVEAGTLMAGSFLAGTALEEAAGKTGSLIAVAFLAGADVREAAEVGSLIAGSIPAGTSFKEASGKTGFLASAAQLRGADVFTVAELGTLAAGTFGAGADVFTATETGTLSPQAFLAGVGELPVALVAGSVSVGDSTGVMLVIAATNGDVAIVDIQP